MENQTMKQKGRQSGHGRPKLYILVVFLPIALLPFVRDICTVMADNKAFSRGTPVGRCISEGQPQLASYKCMLQLYQITSGVNEGAQILTQQVSGELLTPKCDTRQGFNTSCAVVGVSTNKCIPSQYKQILAILLKLSCERTQSLTWVEAETHLLESMQEIEVCKVHS